MITCDRVSFVQFKNVENTHGGVLLLIKYAGNFTKKDIPPWVFFTFFKIVQMILNPAKHLIYFKNKFPFKKEVIMNN